MINIGITYNPSTNIFYSGSNQTAILLVELFQKLGDDYNITLVDFKNNDDIDWWADFPKLNNVTLDRLYKVSGLDFLIDIDGLSQPMYRKKAAKHTIIFLRHFLQFTEMDMSIYPEKQFPLRNFENAFEVWCWDILNPLETIPSIQTMFSCPIRRVPFIWSPTIISHFINSIDKPNIKINNHNKWTIHISEENNNTTSTSIIPLVAIRELYLKNIINADYKCHNMEHLLDNRFLKENILDNIEINKLPIEFTNNIQLYEELNSTKSILFSHSRFIPIKVSLINAIWMGIPLVHNSNIIASLHPSLNKMMYNSNDIKEIVAAFSWVDIHHNIYYNSGDDIKNTIIQKWGINTHLDNWKDIIEDICQNMLPIRGVIKKKEIIIGFSDMWPGFNYDSNFIIDGLRNECLSNNLDINIISVEYSHVNNNPDLLIFGPFSNNWKLVSTHKNIPKVLFSGENWKLPENDTQINLYLSPARKEDDKHIRLPTWMIFIDWFSNSKELPKNTNDNPIRFPLHFAMTSHPNSYDKRNEFCGFVVSNPVCTMRNDTFNCINNYKRVNSGGGLFNNIGGQLALKYPGGGGGDISKYEFLSQHKFSISFENSQAPGYITEKVLHSKIAGCVPIYWGDENTDTDFTTDSFINISKLSNPTDVLEIIKKLELMPEICAKIASTPILNEEKKQKALTIISHISRKLLKLAGITIENTGNIKKNTEHKFHLNKIDKTYVINLDSRQDRWNNFCREEPIISKISERISATNGKTLILNKFIHSLFNNNNFGWKKAIMGCALSHISIWAKILSQPDLGNTFLILEDDVRFNPDLLNKWEEYSNNLPENAELAYLGGILPPNMNAFKTVVEPINNYWAKIKPNNMLTGNVFVPLFHFCTYSYIITRKGVEKIMKDLIEAKIPCAVDHFLGRQSLNLNTYVAWPLITKCFQDDDPSYQLAQFNNIHTSVQFDSDIYNSVEQFSENDIKIFAENGCDQNKIIKVKNEVEKIVEDTNQIVFYHNSENNMAKLYEHEWISEFFPNYRLEHINKIDYTNIKNNTWFIVQRPHLDFFNKYLSSIPSNINFKVLHLSDEFSIDCIDFYTLPNCKGVVRNYIRPDIPQLPHIITIPLGYHYKGNNKNNENNKSFIERELIWSFHGNSWFNRKNYIECFSSLTPNSCYFIDEWNSPQMTIESEYISIMSNSKFCPVFRGNNIETFRLYECLEVGTIPIYIRCQNDNNYWDILSKNLKPINIESVEMGIKLIEFFINNPNEAENYRQHLIKNWLDWKSRIKSNIAVLLNK